MTLQEIKDLKDKIYEIEGLLELAQMREDKIPELEPLIRVRIDALSMDAPDINGQEDTVEVEIASEESSEPNEEVLKEESAAEEEIDMEEEDLEASPEMEPAVQIPTGTFTELFEESESVSVSRPADDLEIPEKPEKIEPQVVSAAPKSTNSARPAFTLNDRFRFRRELFSNSDAEYSSAMDLIASMENYEEAEEYFLDELGWSLDNPEVKDFMEIIQNYFG